MVLVIGLVVVFFGLVLLIGLIKIMTMLTQEHKKKAAAAAPAVPVAAEEVPVQSDDALIAVITAAIACAMEEGTGFTVRRVRRINNAPAWQKAGREEQIYSRF